MKFRVSLLVASLFCFASSAAVADNVILTGTFDGSEAMTDPLPDACLDARTQLWYQEIPVTVSVTGFYLVQDVYNFNEGVDLTINIYENSFNPADPEANSITPFGIDVLEDVQLNAGVNYVFVVQNWCSNTEGAWAVSLSGDGSVTSENLAAIPQYTNGTIGADNMTMSTNECGTSRYFASETTQVQRTTTYYYVDLSISFDLDICLHVYEGSFDPANPQTNRIAFVDDIETLELTAGQDYVFVVQPYEGLDTGEFFYALVAEQPFFINNSVAGSWYYPPTDGTGLFMDVFGNSNILFVAWFTFDLERPPEGTEAMIGDPGHRWVTGIGPFTGNSAQLDLFWTGGMIFDSATPPKNTVQDGNMTIEFDDCLNGKVIYDLGSANVTGEFPIQRLATENAWRCDETLAKPGEPGPL